MREKNKITLEGLASFYPDRPEGDSISAIYWLVDAVHELAREVKSLKDRAEEYSEDE